MTPPMPAWPFLPASTPAPWLFISRFDPAQFCETAWHQADVERPATLEHAATKRRAEYLAGRYCARQALLALGLEASALLPLADRQPQWPSEACGSITHSHGLAAALVASRHHWRGAGIDTERWLDFTRAERIAPAVLTSREREALHSIPPGDRARCVTLTFSLKESLFKALYPLTGTRFYFHDAELEPETLPRLLEQRGRCLLELRRSLSDAWPAGARLEGDFAELEERAITFIGVAHNAH
ncbi:hypothetical protein BH688_01700 [Kushneria phosphatilytica]|nr:hypothetical protein BH688_01700 [Kushneria phosphatilytica]